ncbi:hypothetical protein [Persicirhabdus sediminis]|uniref:Uncharacterized protein n=1 Tax=Persicirhabdus sediminis TaxID=454144 RepID=A0A8J7SLQ9_9BACT|nr:hypothetical protein [Persicirhabdus sediminis]MBK1791530.1 hypothetical protein [Persicirhabdus sediminis]
MQTITNTLIAPATPNCKTQHWLVTDGGVEFTETFGPRTYKKMHIDWADIVSTDARSITLKDKSRILVNLDNFGDRGEQGRREFILELREKWQDSGAASWLENETRKINRQRRVFSLYLPLLTFCTMILPWALIQLLYFCAALSVGEYLVEPEFGLRFVMLGGISMVVSWLFHYTCIQPQLDNLQRQIESRVRK